MDVVDPSDHESLLQFMYQIPFGVAQLLPDGSLGMANPAAIQLVLQIAPGSLNLYEVLARFAPEVEFLVRDFSADRGAILEDYRVDFGMRGPSAPYPLVVAFSVSKLGPDRLMVTMLDVSRSVAAERSARTAEQQLRALMDGVKDYAVVGLDTMGRIADWNVSAARLFAFDRGTALGKPLQWLVTDDGPHLDPALERTRRTGWSTLEASWRRLDVCTFRGTCVLTVVEGEGGEVEGFTCVVRDQSDEVTDPGRRSPERDQETGLHGRNGFERLKERFLAGARRTNAPVGVVLLEIDRYAAIRDRLGEEARADTMRMVVGSIRENLRSSDVAVRYDEGQILLLLPNTDLHAARAVAERIRATQETRVLDTELALVKVTLSAGVTTVEGGEAVLGPALVRVTQGLETARSRGSNQVVLAHPTEARAAG